MQLLTKFQKNYVHRVQSHLMSTMNPVYNFFQNYAKSCVLSRLLKFDGIKHSVHHAIFE